MIIVARCHVLPTIPTLLVMLTAIFALVWLVAGDAATAIPSDQASAAPPMFQRTR